MTSENLRDQLNQIPTEKLHSIALSLGFLKIHTFPGRSILYNFPEDDTVQLDIPLTKEFQDYAYSVHRIIDMISKALDLEFSEVLLSIVNPAMDRIQYHVEGASTRNQAIGLLDALALQTAVVEQLRAAAHDQIKSEIHHQIQNKRMADTFLSQCIAVPPSPGSYVLQVYTPVDLATAIRKNDRKLLPEELPDETFARRTTVSMLSKLKLSVDEINAGQTDELIIKNLTAKDFPERISVNLFKAFSMLSLVDKTAKITIEASWSPASPKPKDNFSNIVLDSGHIDTFKYVYQRMLPKTSNPSAIIKGKIEYLAGDEDGLGIFQGEVLIKGRDQDDKIVNVRVTLSPDDYDRAFEYIKASEEVEIVGAHHRVSGRKESHLYNYTNFHSLGRGVKSSRPMNLKEEQAEYEA